MGEDVSVKQIEVDVEGRLDKVLAGELSFSRSSIQDWIQRGKVRVGGRLVDTKSHSVHPGVEVEVEVPRTVQQEEELRPEPGNLPVVYEDDDLIAVNKPRDLVVHPAPGHPDGTLANRLVHHYPELTEVGPAHRGGMVHRLDRETTGVMLVARNQVSYDELKRQFAERVPKKTYRTVLEGEMTDETVRVRVPIGQDPENFVLRQADPAGKPAETRFKIEARGDFRTAAWAHPKTGRTHQIRVHGQYLGHPVLGDEKYGTITSGKLMLHAESIQFQHPTLNESLTLQSDPPEEVLETWDDILARP